MEKIKGLKYVISKLSQKRYYLEKQIEQTPRILPACLIMRYRARGRRDFQSVKERSKLPGGKSYAYLTYLEGGVTRHRYIPKNKIGEVARLTGSYKVFCEKMKAVRSLNRRIVEQLDKIGKAQKEDVKDYVTKRSERVGKKKSTG
ncbi:MAG: hypothetical protein AB1349_13985 [Elusimicrobiota bacterium]